MVGVAGLFCLVVGLALLFFASGAASAVGLIVAVLAVAFMVADQLPAGLLGGWLARGPASGGRTQDAGPDYIPETVPPSEGLWHKEQAQYDQKNAPE